MFKVLTGPGNPAKTYEQLGVIIAVKAGKSLEACSCLVDEINSELKRRNKAEMSNIEQQKYIELVMDSENYQIYIFENKKVIVEIFQQIFI